MKKEILKKIIEEKQKAIAKNKIILKDGHPEIRNEKRTV